MVRLCYWGGDVGVKPQRGSRSDAEPLREVNIFFPHTRFVHILSRNHQLLQIFGSKVYTHLFLRIGS